MTTYFITTIMMAYGMLSQENLLTNIGMTEKQKVLLNQKTLQH
jgi:hypothetical protein